MWPLYFAFFVTWAYLWPFKGTRYRKFFNDPPFWKACLLETEFVGDYDRGFRLEITKLEQYKITENVLKIDDNLNTVFHV